MNKIADVDIQSVFLGSSNANLSDVGGISLYVSAIIAGAISVSGIILLFLLIGGGISIISGAGKSDPQSVQKGKQAVTSALIGFVVVFTAYWIVKLIETITGLSLI
ncbi:MAG: hypothetical protein WA152_02090 [Microgenomates group bacterium]